jgi:uncharacterized protein (TIGR02996 family)
MPRDEVFLSEIAASPEEEGLRLIYADWLEEQGDARSAARAEFLRLEVALSHAPDEGRRAEITDRLRELRAGIEVDWLAAVARSRIEKCAPRFLYRCPKQWGELKPTDRPTVRSCGTCRRNVYFCATAEELRHHAGLGRCVAVDCTVPRRKGDERTRRRPARPVRRMGRIRLPLVRPQRQP